jgi:aspartyl protease family protein
VKVREGLVRSSPPPDDPARGQRRRGSREPLNRPGPDSRIRENDGRLQAFLGVRRLLRATLVAAFFMAAAPAAFSAPTVMVMSLAQDRADVVINGSVIRTLRSGQTSPEGVLLVSANRDEALIEIEGRQFVFKLGGTNAPETSIRADRAGHFWTTAVINGAATPVLIDTGATFVAIPAEQAGRMGLRYGEGQRVTIRTAGGARAGYRVSLASIRVGDITLYNVDGVVMAGGADGLEAVVVGMSFLNGVEMRRAGDTLTLTQRR